MRGNIKVEVKSDDAYFCRTDVPQEVAQEIVQKLIQIPDKRNNNDDE